MVMTFLDLDRSSARALLDSAMAVEGCVSLDEFQQWLDARRAINRFSVARIPLSDLKDWRFEEGAGNLTHRSGRFFRIEGLDVTTNFGSTPHWMQPIINQPEIGILGFITRKIGGLLHFLVQAKMEPGNINMLQLSPTVQATRSNYTQVHGGNRPPYLDYFLGHTRVRVLVDQLQSEQGARFLRKRNRNMIVEVDEREELPELPDFNWLTLGQLFELLLLDNLVNMDSRTVLSCIRPTARDPGRNPTSVAQTDFRERIYVSATAPDAWAANRMDAMIHWLTRMKTQYELKTSRVPLKDVADWVYDGEQIRHKDGKFFSVMGVSVEASNREVTCWQQPLIESSKGGVLAFLCRPIRGVLHFLVQGRVEPGNFDCVELAPTLQCTPSNYDRQRPETLPPFYDLVLNAAPEQMRYGALQSEEGGRFYHDVNRYLVVELDQAGELELPENYAWMTVAQLKEFIRFNNNVNIEARGLISCLGLRKPAVSRGQISRRNLRPSEAE
jgi:oxidase EvaA